MNYLGVDYGEKRMGLAKADGDIEIALPLKTIKVNGDILEKLQETIADEGIGLVVLGLPISLDGGEYNFAKKVRNFGEKLAKKTGAKVRFQNEVLSSQQAARQEGADIDSSAAALILQSFLDQKK